MKQIREIRIEGVSNGILVTAGCLKLVYAEKEFGVFFKDLKSYFEDPQKAEKEIRKRWGIPSEEPGVLRIEESNMVLGTRSPNVKLHVT